MGTVVYGCGCTFSYSMFGEREGMGWTLCWEHRHHPDVTAAHCEQSEIHGMIMRLLGIATEVT